VNCISVRFRFVALLGVFLAAIAVGRAAESAEFPAELRRTRPVDDIGRAVVYTINESIVAPAELELARRTGSDVLIRGWFKWHDAPQFGRYAGLVPQAHAMGALFGGGITCSALYDGENGLSEAQVRDFATRDAEGRLVDAWNTPGCRHGTLSNPAYLEYLLSWCKQQIDAGADYLFMDEIDAALHAHEGFDDYAIADFRAFLLDRHGRQGWTPTDARWRETFQIDLSDARTTADGTMNAFAYRGYLAAHGLTATPNAPTNPLAASWQDFRQHRDQRAWKWLREAIRAHAAAQGRHVLLSGNGLARGVDLQVLGVWGHWRAHEGRVDLSDNQIHHWASTVVAGHELAGRRVPVVFFHDWGFGGFPWMQVPPEDRRLWMRVRGAEIYAAGAFFAFPVLGPFGNDCRNDGTLAEVVRQSEFYHRHASLYLDAELLGFEPLDADQPDVSLALWRQPSSESLALHVINRRARDGQPVVRDVKVRVPVAALPKQLRLVSPDWPDERTARAAIVDGRLEVSIPQLEAYTVAILSFDRLPTVALGGRRFAVEPRWARPERSEFAVGDGGRIERADMLPGILQGMLHPPMRNPPTFEVDMPDGGSLRIGLRSVSTLGAKLQWRVDGQVRQTIDVADRDGKNDAMAGELNDTLTFAIPPGRHRLTLDNVGPDWVSIAWYAIDGKIAPR
jgi:hypothetical protein